MRCPNVSPGGARCRLPDTRGAHDPAHAGTDVVGVHVTWATGDGDETRWGPATEPAPQPSTRARPPDTAVAYLADRAAAYTRAARNAKKNGLPDQADAYRLTALELGDLADHLTTKEAGTP